MTASDIPTPYDTEIAAVRQRRQEATSKVYQSVLLDKLGRLEGAAEGYRRAQAEAAPLLEALLVVRDCISYPQHPDGSIARLTQREYNIVTAAIAQFEKE